MNKDRRKEIEAVKKRLNTELTGLFHIRDVVETIRDDVDEIRAAEEEYYEGMPESLQAGEKGDKAQAAVYALQFVYDALDTVSAALEDFDQIEDKLDEAAE